MNARQIQTATRLVLAGELSKHAVQEGSRATLRASAGSKRKGGL